MRWNLWSWKHDSHAQYTRYRAEMLVVHCAQTWAQGQFETIFKQGPVHCFSTWSLLCPILYDRHNHWCSGVYFVLYLLLDF